MAAHLRQNLCRRDRFFAAFDEFSINRPENRLLHSALRRALAWTASQAHQQLARELCFVFAEVPVSEQPALDFQRVRLDRGMGHYADALAWARLILQDESPLTGAGNNGAPSLLFPRYHQLDCVNSLLSATLEEGVGQTYLVQHSAGSGKSNTIGWTAHRLSSLFDDKNQKVFTSVIVITDRRVLDQQPLSGVRGTARPTRYSPSA